MKMKNIYRFASLLVVISLLISTRLVARASGSDAPAQAATNYSNLAWFYKPPADGNVTLIAQNYSTFITTKGNETFRDQLISLGAQPPMLEYLRFEAIMNPGSCTATPWKNNVAFKVGDFCDISANHPDWFLLDTNGNRIMHLTNTTEFYYMDPGNAGWRAFFLSRVKEIFAADPVWDGVFLDNVEETNIFHVKDGENLAKYPDNASFQAAVQGFLQYLRANFFQPNGKLLTVNLIARTDDAYFTDYLTYLDGVMHEGWAIDDPDRWRSAAEWEKHMALAEKTQAMGKLIILVGHGQQADTELQNFAYASYLLVANGKSTFRYGSDKAYNQAWLYDNYQLNLGAPLGKRYLSGTAWKRDFANGTVSVDPNSHVATIKLGSNPTATSIPPTATAQPANTAVPTATAISPTSTKLTFTPVADTYVIESSPGVNYGTSTSIRVDNTPITRTYLRFTVSGLNGSAVQSAKLRIYANSSNTAGFIVSAVANTSWGENTMTYTSSPAQGNAIATSTAITAAAWTEVDVTSYIQTEGTYNLALTTSGDTNTNLAARESGANAPQLIITKGSQATAAPTQISAPTKTPTPQPTSAPTQAATAIFTPTKTSTPRPTATPATSVTTQSYDNTASVVTYTSDWSKVTDSQASNGSYAQSRVLGGAVTFKFTGRSFSFEFLAQPNGGTLKLYIDGVYYHYINEYSSSIRYRKPWTLSSADILTSGPHEVKLVFDNPSGRVVTFDGFTAIP
jgi:hypothetical protein